MRKTQATEFIYDDLTTKPKDLHEAVQQRKEIDKYFLQQPAAVRKAFNDNTEIFYQNLKSGNFTKLLQTGVFNEEIAERMKGATNEQQTNTVEKENSNSENIPSDSN